MATYRKGQDFSKNEEINLGDYTISVDNIRKEENLRIVFMGTPSFAIPALKGLIEFSKKTKKPLVLCSTGYSKEDLEFIDKTSKEMPLFKSANMSIGVNLINLVLKKIAPVLYKDFDIELVERHHNQKVDSPSGTALYLAHTIQDSLDEETKLIYGREGYGKREKNEICVNTVRGGGIIGDHEVIFAGDGEVIEINHKAISREVFAIGSLKACEYMANVSKAGKYSMDDVLNIEL